jgi:hypothetical protein
MADKPQKALDKIEQQLQFFDPILGGNRILLSDEVKLIRETLNGMNEEKRYQLIADGHCGKCDYQNMVPLCEERIYDGGLDIYYYKVYCNHCGARVDFTDYYERVTEDTIVMYLDRIIPMIRNCTGWYFNAAYVQSRIDMCKRVIHEFYRNEFKDDLWTPQCNPYVLMYASKALYDLMDLMRDYKDGKFVVKPEADPINI